MKKRLIRIILFCVAICFISQVPIFSTVAHTTNVNTSSTVSSLFLASPIDLLIVLSPQYSNDAEINTAITTYITAVKNDIEWTTQVVPITQENNEVELIDQLIEHYYQTDAIKACLLVGEDLATALGGDSDYLEQPSIVPWFTTGGSAAYELSNEGVVCKPYTIDICISLLYPTHDLSYEQKKSSLISAFTKFSTQRHITYSNTIQVLESSELNTNSQALYQKLQQYSNLHYLEDPTETEIQKTFSESYAAYLIHGHSNPARTSLSAQDEHSWFSAEDANKIHTPLFGADGCYVSGWWSNQPDNNHLDPSIDAPWYGSQMFTSTEIHVMALGMLSQNGYAQPVSFLENALPELLEGKTLAEAMLGDSCIGDTIIIGDPTFHFTL
jgi:hypothetical protein